MKRKFRLTSPNDFKRVRQLGKSYAHPLVVLVAHPNGLEISRFAVVAGRSLGSAVRRNRAKRLLRAALEPFWAHLAPGWDVLLLARKPAAEVKCQLVQDALRQLLKRSHLLIENYDERDSTGNFRPR